MSNSYFRFKQFTVYHNLCSMKVGTDGVLLGAWASVQNHPKHVLDVGTGSGLIALMMAQRTNALIDALDIDEQAITQTCLNIRESPWYKRIHVYHTSLQEFTINTTLKYDLIVSNPPYFINSQKTKDKKRTTARHTDALSHESLLSCSTHLIKKTGKICIILPVQEGLKCVKYAETLGLYLCRLKYVYPKPTQFAKRVLLEFSFTKQCFVCSAITIETEKRHEYTEAFRTMLKDFYLYL